MPDYCLTGIDDSNVMSMSPVFTTSDFLGSHAISKMSIYFLDYCLGFGFSSKSSKISLDLANCAGFGAGFYTF